VKVSKKSEYAIFALVEIALRAGEGAEWLQISQIAGSTGIPEKFLEQILLTLKKAGYLQSRRGMDGGYAMKARPESIHLDQVIELMDGSIQAEAEPLGKGSEKRELLISILEESEEAARAVLRAMTIADMVSRILALKSRKSGFEYQI
jgi:Rrf2 family transcriptional regulator, cysteine metabolism repressor